MDVHICVCVCLCIIHSFLFILLLCFSYLNFYNKGEKKTNSHKRLESDLIENKISNDEVNIHVFALACVSQIIC